MEYIMGQCPHCLNVMSMPDDSELVRCPTCQAEVKVLEAATLAGAAPELLARLGGQPQPQQQAQPGPYTAPAPNPNGPAPIPAVNPGNAPFLGTWKTNVLFTILGIAASILVNSLPELLGEDSTIPGAISLIYVIFSIVYALKYYPSFFGEKPMVGSNEAISFLNTFVGGIIFGLLWNHNLTRREKGISNIVFVVLIGVVFLLAILLAVGVVAYLLS